MKLTCVIIDDEISNVKLFKYYLEKHTTTFEVLECSTNFRESVSVLNQFTPDVVFLDIDL